MEKYFGSSTERSFVSNMGIFPLLFFRIICLPVDCDNDHSEKLADWATPDDVAAAFPGVSLAVHYSRFHNCEKNSKPARPKFHILFPINFMTDAAAYSDMKKLVYTIFHAGAGCGPILFRHHHCRGRDSRRHPEPDRITAGRGFL